MFDLMKRLAQLDAKNPNVVKENTEIAECGPMGMPGGMESSNTPANISITAGSGEELSNMLTSIMKLAGVEKVTPDHLGSEPEPAALTATPVMGVGPAVGDRDDMRAVLDKMNDAGEEDGEEETDEGHDEFGISGVDNTPNRPDAHKPFSANAYAQNTNDGDGKDQAGHHRTGMQPTATYESLMDEYRKFVAEDSVQDFLDAGGKIQQIKPQKGPKRPGLGFASKHIGGSGDGTRRSRSGLGANTSSNTKPVVAAEDDDIAERMGEAIPIQIKFEDGTVKSERIVDGEPTSMMTRPELVQHFSEKYKKPVAGITSSTEPTSHSAPAPTATKDTGFGNQDNDAFNRAHSRYDRQVPETVMDEDLQADDGEFYKNADDFFSQFEADWFDDEQTSPDGMEIHGYIDGVCVMAWRYKSSKKIGGWGNYDDSGLSEMFQFDSPKGKDRGPRDNGNDELARREKAIRPGGLGRGGMAGKEYKEKGRYGDAYKIAGPKGRLPENK